MDDLNGVILQSISSAEEAQGSSNLHFIDIGPIFAGHEWETGPATSFIAPGKLCLDPSHSDPIAQAECAALPGVHPTVEAQQQVAELIQSELSVLGLAPVRDAAAASMPG